MKNDFMNKSLLATAVMAMLLSACSDKGAATPAAASEAITTKHEPETSVVSVPPTKTITAQQVIDAFKAAKIPVGKVLVRDENNDPNHLLGRPNQYVEKIDFVDTRIEQPNQQFSPGEIKGGYIEVFTKEDDLQARKSYVEKVTQAMPIFTQYIYPHHLVLLRLEHELTPTQAKEYQRVLESL